MSARHGVPTLVRELSSSGASAGLRLKPSGRDGARAVSALLSLSTVLQLPVRQYCRQAGDPGTTTEDRPGAWAGGYGMCPFALILLSLGRTQRYRPGATGSSIPGPGVAGEAYLRGTSDAAQ